MAVSGCRSLPASIAWKFRCFGLTSLHSNCEVCFPCIFITIIIICFVVEIFLPAYHDLEGIRSMVLDPTKRCQLQCVSGGENMVVVLEINVLQSNFNEEDVVVN